MKKFKIRIPTIIIWWLVFLLITTLAVLAMDYSIKTEIIILSISVPVLFVIALGLYLLCMAFYSRKFITVQRLYNNYGPGEKCAEELTVLYIGEKDIELKNIYLISLATVYMDLGEPEEVLKTLDKVNKRELLRFSFNPLHKKLECEYYYLKMSAYDALEDKDNVIATYKQGRKLFNKFYNKKSEPLIYLTIQYNIESCLENYEKCNKILNHFHSSDNDMIKATALLCNAEIYIKTGRLEEAESLLKDIKHRIYGIANAKQYEKLCNKIIELKNPKEEDLII